MNWSIVIDVILWGFLIAFFRLAIWPPLRASLLNHRDERALDRRDETEREIKRALQILGPAAFERMLIAPQIYETYCNAPSLSSPFAHAAMEAETYQKPATMWEPISLKEELDRR